MGLMNGSMLGAMMIGGGLLLLLVTAVLILSLAALVKYLRGPR